MVKCRAPVVYKHKMTWRRVRTQENSDKQKTRSDRVFCFVPLCVYQRWSSRNVQLRRWSGVRILCFANVSKTILRTLGRWRLSCAKWVSKWLINL